MKTGSCGSRPCTLRLDVVAELVHEDQQHEPDREPPAPDQRVAADREEDPEELEREHPELEERARGDARASAAIRPRQRPARAVVLARERRGLRRRHRLEVAGRSGRSSTCRPSPGAGSRSLPDPFLAAHVDLLLPQRHGLLERVDRVAARGERLRRWAAETAITTLVSPISTTRRGGGSRCRSSVVARAELLRDPLHLLLGHALVRLVLEPHHVPAARVRARVCRRTSRSRPRRRRRPRDRVVERERLARRAGTRRRRRAGSAPPRRPRRAACSRSA